MATTGSIVLFTLPLPGDPKVRAAIVTSTDDPRGHGLSVLMDGVRDWDQEMRGELISEGMTLSGMALGHVFAKQGAGAGTWAYRPSLVTVPTRDARTADLVAAAVAPQE